METEQNESLEERAFKEWLQHPVTIKLRKAAHERREVIKDQWEHGNISDWVKDIHVLLNAAAIGECRAYSWVENLEWDQLEEQDDAPVKLEGSAKSE